jgi:predicted nucleic-acid-binding protein
MSDRRLADTNLIIRFLVEDHAKHAQVAAGLFAAADRSEIVLAVHPTVLAECVFVLESFYECPRGDIASVLSRLISSPGVEIGNAAVYRDALDRYGRTKCHFVDCILAATAAAEDSPVATFDEDFRKFPDVRVKTD